MVKEIKKKIGLESHKNNLIWYCNHCGFITPRHAETDAEDMEFCSHCWKHRRVLYSNWVKGHIRIKDETIVLEENAPVG